MLGVAMCPRCKRNERLAGQSWCRECLSAYQRERRLAQRPSSAVPPPTAAEARASFAKIMAGCRECERLAVVRAVIEEHRRLVGDVGLYGRAKVPWLVTKVLAALEER